MRSTRDFLTGLLTGVAIGILTAPRSGKETRDLLVEEANKRSDDLKDQWEKGVAQAKDQYGKVKDQANQYVGQAKDQYNQLKGQATEKLDQYKSQANQQADQYNAQADYSKQEAKTDYNDAVDDLADNTKSGVNTAKESFKID